MKKPRLRFTLNEDTLLEAEQIVYEYTYFYDGAHYTEEQLRQKLTLLIKSLKSVSAVAVIPEVVEILVSGLKEGSEVKGYAMFELGGVAIKVMAKKFVKHIDAEDVVDANDLKDDNTQK
jgi:hypothetical protein